MVTCNGSGDGSVTVTGSGGWVRLEIIHTYGVMGQTNATATNLAPGSYNVTMTDDNGCQVYSSGGNDYRTNIISCFPMGLTTMVTG